MSKINRSTICKICSNLSPLTDFKYFILVYCVKCEIYKCPNCQGGNSVCDTCLEDIRLKQTKEVSCEISSHNLKVICDLCGNSVCRICDINAYRECDECSLNEEREYYRGI